MIEWLAPAALFGTLAVAIPVILHFTGGKAAVPVTLPTLKFLAAGEVDARRRHRIRDILLLAARMALIVFLFIAAAGPRLVNTRFGPDPSLDGVVIIVVDSSMSMMHDDPDGRRHDKALVQANQLLESLAPTARVSLIDAANDIDVLVSRPTIDHARVASLIERISPRPQSSDILKSIGAASAIIARNRRENKTSAGGTPATIVMFTDLSGTFIKPDTPARLAETLGSSTTLVFIDVANGQPVNGAVTGVSVSPAWGTPGGELTVDADILPPAHATEVDLAIEFDGDAVRRMQVDVPDPLPPSGIFHIRQTATVPINGAESGRIVLTTSDRLPIDNARSFILFREHNVNILVIDGDPTALDGRGSAYYIQAMLAAGRGRIRDAMTIASTVADTGALSHRDIARFTHVILVDPGVLDDVKWSKLRRFTETGGNLIYYSGPHTDIAALKHVSARADAPRGGLLPIIPAEIGIRALNPSQGLKIRDRHTGHALLDLSRIHPLQSIFDKVLVERILNVTPPAPPVVDSAPDTFLTTTGGRAAGIIRRYGSGTVTFFSIPPTLDFSDWPVFGGAFLTLNLDLIRQTRGGDSTVLNLKLGDNTSRPLPEHAKPTHLWRVRLDAPQPENAIRTTPSAGAPETSKPNTTKSDASSIPDWNRLKANAERLPVLPLTSMSILSPSQPGAYRYIMELSNGRPIVQNAVYSLPPGESNLSEPDPAIIESLSRNAVIVSPSIHAALQRVTKPDRRADLTIPILWLIAVLAGFEAWMAARMYRRKSTAANTTPPAENTTPEAPL